MACLNASVGLAIVGTLTKAGWALVELDKEVTDKYGRVLGYVYESFAEKLEKTC